MLSAFSFQLSALGFEHQAISALRLKLVRADSWELMADSVL
jgi:hypothetical protein